MDKRLPLLLSLGVCLLMVGLPFSSLSGQCENQSQFLGDTSVPVSGDPSQAYCFDFTFDPDETGYPLGIAFSLQHTFEGDIGVFVLAGGNVLNVVQRPGSVGNCSGGCPCGSPASVNGGFEFTDGGGPDPEDGLGNGGSFGITSDDACGIGTPGIGTFADLWAAYGPGIVFATICIADHAAADEGPAADLTFIFPNPVECGCTDPFAVNYDPTANVDDGSCVFCDFLNLQVVPDFFSSCPGTMIQLEATSMATDPIYEWVGQGGEESFLDDPSRRDPTVSIPPDFSGTIIYTVTVTDDIGCMESWDVTIDVQPPFDVAIEGEAFVCASGVVDLTTDPRFFSAYEWSTGETGDQISVGPGDYEVTVTDFNGCQVTAEFTVEEAPEVEVEIIGPEEVCNGGRGDITLGVDDFFLSYLWSTGENSEEIIVNQPGLYEVTVTDFSGCEGTAAIEMQERDPLEVDILGDPAFCEGSSTTLSVDPDYTSTQWSTGVGTFSTEVLTSGTVTVTVVDSEGCEGEESIEVEAISAPVPTISGPNAICPNQGVTLGVAEDFSSYEWSNGSSGRGNNINTPGVYSVTVTDDNNCVGSGEIIIDTAPVPDLSIVSGELEFCAGSTADIVVTGGFDSYEWSNGSFDPTTTIDMGGNYTVTVTNVEGCSNTISWTISERSLPTPAISGDLDICPGTTTELIADGNFATYDWSNGDNGTNSMVSTAGDYTVSVTDAFGCAGTATVSVEELQSPSPTIAGNLSYCLNESSTLSTVVPYDAYAWSTGESTSTVQVSTPGPVTVTVTDDEGCTGTTEATLVENAPAVNIVGAPTFCEDEQTTLSLDDTFAAYSWSTGANTLTTDVSVAGNVSITVTDDNGCEATDEITLSTWALPAVDITGRLTFCPGTEASLDATPGYITYAWSNNASGASITTDVVGSYTVTVTDGNSCQNTATIQVTEDENLSPTISGDLEFCTGTSTQLMGDAGYLTYSWSNGQSGPALTVTEAGNYTLSVTDAFGCSGEVTVSPSTFALPTPGITGALAYCAQSSTTLSADDTYTSYQWNGGSTDPQIMVTTPGDYQLTVTDDNGCVGSTTATVVENPLPTFSIAGSENFCPGERTELTAPVGFASYNWSTGATTPGVEVGMEGNVSVSVIDDNGCEATADIELTGWTSPPVDITGRLTFCPGTEATLDATPGYETYAWSNNGSSASITTDMAGNYTVTVTDSNGCQNTTTAQVFEEESLSPSVSGELEFCTGTSTQLTGDDGYLTYTWSNGQSGPQLTVSDPGPYTLSVTDTEGCSGEVTVDVEALALPTPGITGALAYCAQSNTTLSADDTYTTYQWNGGSTDPQIMVTNPGDYQLTVTDDNGCVGSTTVTVVENPLPAFSIAGSENFCPGERTQLTAPVGFASYSWSTGANTPAVEVGTEGNVSVSVIDDNGCEATADIDLTSWTSPPVDITGRLTFCPGTEASLDATPGYETYAWSNNGSGASITTDMAGSYTVTVTDSNGCENTTTAQVFEEENLSPSVSGDLAFCTGTSTQLTGDAGYLTYSWSNGQDGPALTVTEAGDYTLSVTDAFGCSGEVTVSASTLALPTPGITGALVYCAQSSTTLSADGTYTTYQWSGGATDSQIVVTNPGDYRLTVSDANGCVNSTSVAVVENPLPTPSIQGVGGFCPGESTQLTAPVGFASYAWSTGATDQGVTISTTGDLSLTVTDDNGCAGSTTRNIAAYTTVEPAIVGELQFCPGENTMLSGQTGFNSYNWSTGSAEEVITTNVRGDVSLTVIDANGCETSSTVNLSNYVVTPPVIDAPVGFCADGNATITAASGYTTYTWSNNSTQPDITITEGGVYEVSVVDANGCPSTNAVDVVAFALPSPQIGGSTTFCTGLSTTLNAGATYASYQWSDGSTTPEVVVNTPGTIGLTVTDANGCVGDTAQGIIEAEELAPVVSGARDFCEDQSTALNAGNGFATYNWSNGSTEPGITVTTPGIYTISVTDAGGCNGETTVEVVENGLPLVEISGVTAFCDGAASELQAPPGFPTYRWSTGAPTASITVMDPATYGLTITDVNGCVDSAAVAVTAQPLPSFTLEGPQEFCANATTEITVTPAYATYQWNTGDTLQTISLDATQLAAVTVTDEFGCENTASVNVSSIAPPLPDAGPETLLDCDNRITTIGTLSQENWSYQWSGPGITASNANQQRPTVDAAGIYTLVVTDNVLGCESNPVTTAVEDLEYVPQIVLEVLDVLDCATSTVLVDGRGSASGSQYVYQWYDGSQQPIEGANSLFFNASMAQFYFLEVLDTITGCDNIADIEVEEDLTFPLAEAGPSQLLTCDITSVELDGSGSQSGGQINYQWEAPDGGFISPSDDVSTTVNQPGWYFLQITDVINDCSNIDSVFVSQDVVRPLAEAGQDFELDCNIPETTLDGTGSSVGGVYAYQWLNSNRLPIESATSLQLDVETPDDYILQVTNTENGCVDEDVVVISINEEAPQALAPITQVPTCAGDEDGMIILAQVEGGIPPFSYSFNGAPFADNIIFEDLSAGDYQVVVEDATGCRLTTTVTLNDGNDLALDLGADLEIEYGETVNIYPEYTVDSTQLSQIDWLTNEGTLICPGCINHLDLEVPTSTQFFLTLVDENGCEVSDELTVFVRRESNIYVPTAFSPDDNGDNDIFYIFADESLVDIKSFLVFNRWGETVFEVYNALPNDPNWGWDGKHRGLPVNPAVYVWMAEVELDTGETVVLKGDVTVMR